MKKTLRLIALLGEDWVQSQTHEKQGHFFLQERDEIIAE